MLILHTLQILYNPKYFVGNTPGQYPCTGRRMISRTLQAVFAPRTRALRPRGLRLEHRLLCGLSLIFYPDSTTCILNIKTRRSNPCDWWFGKNRAKHTITNKYKKTHKCTCVYMRALRGLLIIL